FPSPDVRPYIRPLRSGSRPVHSASAKVTSAERSHRPARPSSPQRYASLLACAWDIIRGQPMRRNLSAYASEFAGTALMLFIGVSAVAFMWAPGSPVPVVPNAALRRLFTGILFAGGATAVVYSPLGQRSGGHINPAVTLAFWRLGKVPTRDAVIYIVMQFLGAFAGAYAAGVAWGPLTTGVQYAATVPGEGYSWAGALVAETFITFLLVFTIFVCV